MSEFDSLIDGFDGLVKAPSSEGERRVDNAEVAGSTPAGPIDEEPPHEPDDWPEPEPPVPLYADAELRALRSDQRPSAGVHFVVYGGVPRPVVREIGRTEDEFVRSHLDVDGLRDPDGQRRNRADRTLRQRYRGYACGEMSSL